MGERGGSLPPGSPRRTLSYDGPSPPTVVWGSAYERLDVFGPRSTSCPTAPVGTLRVVCRGLDKPGETPRKVPLSEPLFGRGRHPFRSWRRPSRRAHKVPSEDLPGCTSPQYTGRSVHDCFPRQRMDLFPSPGEGDRPDLPLHRRGRTPLGSLSPPSRGFVGSWRGWGTVVPLLSTLVWVSSGHLFCASRRDRGDKVQ